MSNIEELIIRKKKENIVLSIIIIILCIIGILFFYNDYIDFSNNDYYKINTKEDLETAINKKIKFVNMDLTNAKAEMYSLSKLDDKNNKLNLYTIDLENKKVMIFLKNNTIITNKVYLNIEKFDGNKLSIKELLNDDEYYDIILSNEKFNENRNFEIYKIYVLISLIVLEVLSIIINTIYYKNPKKTYRYKKYMKKLYI